MPKRPNCGCGMNNIRKSNNGKQMWQWTDPLTAWKVALRINQIVPNYSIANQFCG
jgi:hypothetical protein